MDTGLYQDLIAEIDEQLLVDSLKEMLSIKSENPFDTETREGFREKEMGQYFAHMMNQLGMETQQVDVVPDRPNIIGIRKGFDRKESLMLAGHMDTAPTEGYAEAYDIQVKDGKVYGRGACDMKAALAAYLEVVRILQKADFKLRGDLMLAGICDEEYKMIGSKHMGRHGPHATQGIIGEPSDLSVCPANKGQLGTIIRTHGRPVHSSVPEKGVNAISHMAKVIEAFEDYNTELLSRTPHPLLGHGRFSPGVIRGGTIVSTVPDCCELEVDRRVLPGETVEQVYNEYRHRIDPLIRTISNFQYEITSPTWEIPANDVSEMEPVVQSLLSATENATGILPHVKAFVAGTDAPNMGFPTVICGPGSIKQAHGKNEYVSVKQLVDAVRIYLYVVVDLLM